MKCSSYWAAWLVSTFSMRWRRKLISRRELSSSTRGSSDRGRKQFGAITIAKFAESIRVELVTVSAANVCRKRSIWRNESKFKLGNSLISETLSSLESDAARNYIISVNTLKIFYNTNLWRQLDRENWFRHFPQPQFQQTARHMRIGRLWIDFELFHFHFQQGDLVNLTGQPENALRGEPVESNNFARQFHLSCLCYLVVVFQIRSPESTVFPTREICLSVTSLTPQVIRQTCYWCKYASLPVWSLSHQALPGHGDCHFQWFSGVVWYKLSKTSCLLSITSQTQTIN